MRPLFPPRPWFPSVTQLILSRIPGSECVNNETSIHRPKREVTTRQIPTRVEHDEVQFGPGTQAQLCEADPVPDDPGREPHMLGDFHGRANAL